MSKDTNKAAPPTGSLPVLKVPDPEFLLGRLKSKKPAGLLSRLQRKERAHKPQLLVNKVAPKGFDAAYVWAVVTFDKPEPFNSYADLSDNRKDGLDDFTKKEFAAETDLWYLPLKLEYAYDKPLKLKKPPEGRRFGSVVDLETDIAKEIARTKVMTGLPTKGLVISPRWMAEAIIDGQKRMIVKTDPAELSGDWVLVNNGLALGTIKLEARKVLSPTQFKRRVGEHLITNELRRQWTEKQESWADGPYYSWPVMVIDKFEEPLKTNATEDPIVDNLQAIKSSPYTSEYFVGQLEPNVQWVLELSKIIPLLKGRTILDIGAGTGRAMDILKEASPTYQPFEVSGIDISEVAVNICTNKGLHIAQASACDLPFDDSAFDSAYSLHTMEHVEDIEKALAESVRIANRAIHIIPLGKRQDPTHEHTFEHMQDLRETVQDMESLQGVAKTFRRIAETNSAILVLDKVAPTSVPILEHIPEHPISVVPGYLSVVGSAVKGSNPEDIDLLIRDIEPPPGLHLKIRNLFPKAMQEQIHWINNPSGPHDDHVPLYDLALVPQKDFGQVQIADLEKQRKLKPITRFKPLKTASGYTAQEFFETSDLWKFWAEPLIDEGQDIEVEQKFNGYRTILQKDNKGKHLVYFEDSRDDRSKQFPPLLSDLESIENGVVLDLDLGATYEDGSVVPRSELGVWISKTKGIDDKGYFETPAGDKARLEPHVFDLLYLDGEDIHDMPWLERRARLEQMFAKHDFRFLQLVPKKVVRAKTALLKTVNAVANRPGSEGAVLKVTTSDYPLTGQTTEWSKWKKHLEIKVQVLGRTPVKDSPRTWNYTVAYLDENGKTKELGKTFNTKVDAKPGQILTLQADEILPEYDEDDKTWGVTVVVPKVADLSTQKKPENVRSIIRRAHTAGVLQATPADLKALSRDKLLKGLVFKQKEGQLDIKEGDEGAGILQVHERGLSEDQVKLYPNQAWGWEPVEITDKMLSQLNSMRKDNWKSAINKAKDGNSQDLAKLVDNAYRNNEDLSASQRKILALVDPVSIHTDIRLRRLKPRKDNWWTGGEGFTPGNQYQPNKFRQLSEGDIPETQKILGNFKVPEAGEESAQDIIRGPLVWLGIGDKKPEAFPPGAVGSTAKAWSRFRIRDKFSWKAGVQDEHFKEFWLEGDVLNGRWIMTFAPVSRDTAQAEGRSWIFSRPKDQEMKSELFRSNNIEKGETDIPILKVNKDQQLVTGLVLVPDKVDAQGDRITAEAIEKAAYEYLAKYNESTKLGLQHKGFPPGLKLVESYIAPADMDLNGKTIIKGSWIITVKVLDSSIWERIKNRQIRGFSMGGVARLSRSYSDKER